jgi:hypothetical protein
MAFSPSSFSAFWRGKPRSVALYSAIVFTFPLIRKQTFYAGALPSDKEAFSCL